MSSRRAVELLLAEANRFLGESRYAEMLRAAESAVQATRAMGDLGLEIRATWLEATAHQMLGDDAAALQRLTWILTVAADPCRRDALAQSDVTENIARAHMDWVEAARFLPEIPATELLGVLEAGETYLRAVGEPEWRAGLLLQRADVLETLGRRDEAMISAEEALALELRHPEAPGYTLATYRWSLGDLLRRLGRVDEAERHYRDVLADGSGSAYAWAVAHAGLGWCALDRGDAATARREADAAVRLAEGMGDDVIGLGLEVLIETCRADGDLAGARRAADRYVKTARRTRSEYGLYFALRDAADVALDEGDAASARALLDEAAPLAALLDRQSGLQENGNYIANRRERLARLDGAS
jgi:tetratricopeptide (TPR) repeat protein